MMQDYTKCGENIKASTCKFLLLHIFLYFVFFDIIRTHQRPFKPKRKQSDNKNKSTPMFNKKVRHFYDQSRFQFLCALKIGCVYFFIIGKKDIKGKRAMHLCTYLCDAILQCALTTFSIAVDKMIWNEDEWEVCLTMNCFSCLDGVLRCGYEELLDVLLLRWLEWVLSSFNWSDHVGFGNWS